MRCFTYNWRHTEVRRYGDGEPLRYAYGSRFTRQGIGPGDEVYIVSVDRHRIHLLGKMQVRFVTPSAEDYQMWLGQPPEVLAQEYLIAEAYTPARCVAIPDDMARLLRFIQGRKWVGLAFRATGVDPQSLRGVRRLTDESGAMLDELLPTLVPAVSIDAPRPEAFEDDPSKLSWQTAHSPGLRKHWAQGFLPFPAE